MRRHDRTSSRDSELEPLEPYHRLASRPDDAGDDEEDEEAPLDHPRSPERRRCSRPRWCPKCLTWRVGALIAVASLLVCGYTAAVVWSGAPYLHHTGPEPIRGLAPHPPRTVWHHAMQRTSRLPALLHPSPCPARDRLGVESDVRLHNGELTLHHNAFVPLYPPAFIMGTMTVTDVVGWLAARVATIGGRYANVVLKLDVKTAAAALVLVDGPGTGGEAHTIARGALQTLRGLGVRVWFNADLVPHSSIAHHSFPFATTGPGLAAAALARYDAVSIGFKWPSGIDDEPYDTATCDAMLRYTVAAVEALRGMPSGATGVARARITFALRWPQLRTAAAGAAVTALLRATRQALGDHTGNRVWLTVWRKTKDGDMGDEDVRELEARFPGCSVDCGGKTPLATDCRPPT